MEAGKLRSSGLAGATEGDFNSRALMARAQRQALLASNIANADTPGYKALDVDFAEVMRASQSNTTLKSTSAAHLPSPKVSLSTLEFARYSEASQPSLDGNTVDLDRERASFSQNALLYQFAVQNLADEYKEFKMAAETPKR